MLDDKFHGHKKTLALFDGPCPGDAIALWTLANSWCGDQLTDGVVPVAFVRRSGLDKRAADELVRVGLWHVHANGYEFHNWLERNKSREKVLAEREAAKRRKADAKPNGGKPGGRPPDEPPSEVREKFSRTSGEPGGNVNGSSGESLATFAPGSFAPDPNSDPEDQSAAAALQEPESKRARGMGHGGYDDVIALETDARAIGSAWDGVGGTSLGPSDIARLQRVRPLLDRLARERGKEPAILFAEAVARFKADPDTRRTSNVKLSVLCSQLENWCGAVESGAARPAAYRVLQPPPGGER